MGQTIILPSFTVTLIYEDGSSWFAGSFNSQIEAEEWVATEQTRFYWKQTTQVQIVDMSTSVTTPN